MTNGENIQIKDDEIKKGLLKDVFIDKDGFFVDNNGSSIINEGFIKKIADNLKDPTIKDGLIGIYIDKKGSFVDKTGSSISHEGLLEQILDELKNQDDFLVRRKITIGTPKNNGEVLVKNDANRDLPTIHLNGNECSLILNNPNMDNPNPEYPSFEVACISLSGLTGRINAGGNGINGSLVLIDANNNPTVMIKSSDKGDIILQGADCAEEFDIISIEHVEPGTVMVIDNNGSLRASEQAYDKRVAGVISGAGDLKPGITLGRQKESANRLPLALTGKVYCKVDAEYGTIEVGDLLTTSSTCGHAMKAEDPLKSFGSVIGKALRPLKTGQDIIPILIALQ